jgi:hypothetical protein
MPSQHHINDCINILLALNFVHIVKVLLKHKYMEGGKFVMWNLDFFHQKSCVNNNNHINLFSN